MNIILLGNNNFSSDDNNNRLKTKIMFAVKTSEETRQSNIRMTITSPDKN